MNVQEIESRISEGEVIITKDKLILVTFTELLASFLTTISQGDKEVDVEVIKAAIGVSEEIGSLKARIHTTGVMLNKLRETREHLINKQAISN